jgi:hypothetical protein
MGGVTVMKYNAQEEALSLTIKISRIKNEIHAL